jgi:hypothetical protein
MCILVLCICPVFAKQLGLFQHSTGGFFLFVWRVILFFKKVLMLLVSIFDQFFNL